VRGETVDADQFAYSALLLVGVFGQYAGGTLSDRLATDRVLIGLLIVVVGATIAPIEPGFQRFAFRAVRMIPAAVLPAPTPEI